MRRGVVIYIAILISILLMSCTKTDIGEDIIIDIGESSKFTKEEISEAIDKQVMIDMQSVTDDREFDSKYVDLTAIQFDIEEIEDDAEEFI